MKEWTEGYVADIGYTYGYYQELNPLRIKLAFLYAGLEFPKIGTACELGFGQGLSTNLHAAASVTRWYGTDFNPAQAIFARTLAAASGADANLFDESFAEFANRNDLPEFDFIGLHGIWSWVSDENRLKIVDFIRRKLRVGGVLYVSYNTLPGWSAFAPIRHLMAHHAEIQGSIGAGIVDRIDGALGFIDKLFAVNPAFSRSNPQIVERFLRLKKHDHHYLAHEYFNRDWHPMHFSTMAEWLAQAKLEFACSAHYLDHIDAINLTSEQQQLLRGLSNPIFRENVRDFVVNQQFRRDYWIRGSRKISTLDQTEALRAHEVVLVTPRSDILLKVQGALGDANLTESIYGPILEVLADHAPHSLMELHDATRSRGITFSQLVQSLMILAGASHLSSVQDAHLRARARTTAATLNSQLLMRSRGAGEVAYLASPITGGGIPVNRINQLFLLAVENGLTMAEQIAEFAWKILSGQGQKIVKEGKPIESEEDNKIELYEQAKAFILKRLPTLRALQVIE